MSKPKFELDRNNKRASIWLTKDVKISFKVIDTPDGKIIEIYKCGDISPMALNIIPHASNIIHIS